MTQITVQDPYIRAFHQVQILNWRPSLSVDHRSFSSDQQFLTFLRSSCQILCICEAYRLDHKYRKRRIREKSFSYRSIESIQRTSSEKTLDRTCHSVPDRTPWPRDQVRDEKAWNRSFLDISFEDSTTVGSLKSDEGWISTNHPSVNFQLDITISIFDPVIKQPLISFIQKQCIHRHREDQLCEVCLMYLSLFIINCCFYSTR